MSKKKWILNPDWVKAGPKADIDFGYGKKVELKADPEAIKKTLREQRERRTIRVKSKLP